MKLVVILLAALAALNAGALEIVKNKRSDYQIVIPDKTGNKSLDDFIALGGKVLRTAIKKSTGVELPLAEESKMIPGKPGLFVGNTRALKKQELSSEKFAPWEHSIVVKGKNIYLFGKDLPNSLKKARWPGQYVHYILGSLKAVCTFAEKYLNTRFTGSIFNSYGENDGVRTLPLKEITVPDQLNYRRKPRFLTIPWDHGGLLYCVANNFLFNSGTLFEAHFHSRAIPQEYYKSHPEYFALINGKRYFDTSGDWAKAQYCLSNPDVQLLIYKKAVEYINNGYRIIELGQADGFRGCECTQCKAWYNTSDWGEKLWCYHRDLAVRLQKEFPHIEIAISCYGATLRLPGSFKRFPGKGVLIDIAPPDKKLMEQFRSFNIRGMSGVTYFFGSYLPCGFSPADSFSEIKKGMKELHASPLVSLCHYNVNELRHLNGPWIYVWGKMLEDPQADTGKLLQEYCLFSFGAKAAPWFEKFFKLIDQRLALFPIGGFDPLTNKSLRGQNTLVLWNKRYPAAVMKQLDRLFAEAVRYSAPGNFMVEKLKVEYEYMQKTAAACYDALAVMNGSSLHNRRQLARSLEVRNRFLDQLPLRKDGRVDKDLFRSQNQTLRRGGLMAGNLGELFAADPEALKNFKSVELVQVKNFSDPQWAKLPSHKLVPGTASSRKNDVSFRIARSTDALLLKLSAPASVLPEKAATVRDSYPSIWQYSTWELFFANGADLRHFAFNAVPGSAYDCVTHPGYSWKAWNPVWQHRDSVKNGVWSSEVTIPLQALRVLPVQGDRWMMQIGFSTPHAKDLYVWSRSLSGGFADLTGFGELRWGKRMSPVRKAEINGDFAKVDSKKGTVSQWRAFPGKTLLVKKDNALVMSGRIKDYLRLQSQVNIPVDGGEALQVRVKVRGEGQLILGCAWKNCVGKFLANSPGQTVTLTGKPQEYSVIFHPGTHMLKGATHVRVNFYLRNPGKEKGNVTFDFIDAQVIKEKKQ